jgi:hypothetical protein
MMLFRVTSSIHLISSIYPDVYSCCGDLLGGEDSIRERKRVWPVHFEIELISYCSESEYIKQNQGTIVYDYQVLTLMYILFS